MLEGYLVSRKKKKTKKKGEYKGLGVHDPNVGEARRVYDPKGDCPPLKNHPLLIKGKKETKIIKSGQLSDYQGDQIYDPDGLSPTLSAQGANNNGGSVLIGKIVVEHDLQPESSQRRKVYNKEGISPCLCEGMGTGGGLIPFVQDKRGGKMDEPKKKIEVGDFRNDEGLRIRKDGNSPTLTSSHTSDGKKDVSMCPPLVMNTLTEATGNRAGSSSEFLSSVDKINKVAGEIRRLTPTECERLQGDPDGWTAKGVDETGKEVTISDTQRYKTLGNAVTTNVIEAIVDKLFYGETYFNQKYGIKVEKPEQFW